VWDINNKSCSVSSDGKAALTLKQNNETLNGLSYLRLRSKPPTVDPAGFFVESVVVDIDDNIAAEVSKQQTDDAAAYYRANLSYHDHPDEASEITAAVKTGNGKFTSTGFWIPNQVEEIKDLLMGPFISLPHGEILTIDGTKSLISKDQGKTWNGYSIFADPDKFSIRKERALIRTRKGVIILAFVNEKERANWNWQNDISDSPGAILPTYAVRSLDGGKTWQNVQKLHEDWTGAIRDMIETKDGSIVFTSMMMRHNPGHHATVTYTSKNQGKTWMRSNIIDLGGIGHHSGVIESTLTQLKNGRLWMLLRTNWGKLWETFSDDEGLTWKEFKPTKIDASSAPAMLKRLKSGRLVLVWNRFYPEGKHQYPLRGGDGIWSEVPVSNQREELSIMFSNDDGKSWSPPKVISKITKPGTQISYPYLFEAKPGELWITTMFGDLRIKLNEKDFIDDEKTDYIGMNKNPGGTVNRLESLCLSGGYLSLAQLTDLIK
jgi:sialidase-1